MVSSEYVVKPLSGKVGGVLQEIRSAGHEPRTLSYIYIVVDDAPVLEGLVALRDLVVARDDATMGDITMSPVVTARADDQRDDLEKLFERYGFNMIPVVDERNHMLGVIPYRDIMKGPEAKS
jgi:magnesium transporter